MRKHTLNIVVFRTKDDAILTRPDRNATFLHEKYCLVFIFCLFSDMRSLEKCSYGISVKKEVTYLWIFASFHQAIM